MIVKGKNLYLKFDYSIKLNPLKKEISLKMNTTSYLPGQGLYNFVSEYITEEEPSPAPAPSPVPAPYPTPEPAPDPVVIAEPVNSCNLLLENDKLKEEVKYMKQEMKVLKSMCGLDRRLKITKIEEEDLHKYYRGDLKSLINSGGGCQMNYYDQSNKDIVILNKSLFDLELSRKSKKSYHSLWLPDGEFTGYNIIPCNGLMVCTVWEGHDADGNKLHTFGQHIDKLIGFSLGPIEYELDFRGDIKKPYSIKHLAKNNSIAYVKGLICGHDINEWFKLNITFPKLPDFMKIENMNTIDIDIYKMKGIYVITYE